MATDAQRANNRRQFEAREKHWTLAADGRSMSRSYGGYELRVDLEDGGYRVYVDGQRRGFHDSASGARSQAIWLADHDNPAWVPQRERTRHLGPQHQYRGPDDQDDLEDP